ncbi:MAG: protein kinase [Clostridium sp.]|nr:protein kinase [Clostridium sp.]
MLNLDKDVVEAVLEELEEGGYLFPQCKFYRINQQFHLLGKGGFSVVYEMVDRENQKERYAMKMIGLERHTVTSDEFRRTTNLQRKLSGQSPYILKIIDTRELCVFLDEEGKLRRVEEQGKENWSGEGIPLQFILMEKLENILVRDKFQNSMLALEALKEEEEILKLAMQIGQAVLTAHDNFVLHRDIKLENIFWDKKEECYKLGDFGMAKYAEEGNAETVIYTDGYGAPEIEYRLRESYNATADIYSFGITLYLLLNGLKFPGSEGYYVNMVQYNPDFIFPAPEKASEEMVRVIRKMCSYRQEERYQSMKNVLADWNYAVGKREIAAEDNVELADLATETYRDEKEKAGVRGEADLLIPDRIARKRRQEEEDKYYRQAGIRRLILLALLSAALLKGLQRETAFAAKWQFWIFPVAVLVEAVLLQIRELQIVFGIGAALSGVFSAYTVGIHAPHILLFAGLASGVPVLAGAGAAGTGLWMLTAFTEKLSWMDWIYRHDVSWLLLALLLVLSNSWILMENQRGKVSRHRTFCWSFFYDMLTVIMIISGIVLMILQRFKGIVIPEILQRIHLVRTGITVSLVMPLVKIWQGAYDENGEEN